MNTKAPKSKLIWSFILPTAAILIGQFCQQLLATLWPGIKILSIGSVSLVSYVSILLTGIFCFLTGHWLKHHVNTRWALALSTLSPLIWFILMASGILSYQSAVEINAITVTIFVAGIVPLATLLAGWMVPNLQVRTPKIINETSNKFFRIISSNFRHGPVNRSATRDTQESEY